MFTCKIAFIQVLFHINAVISFPHDLDVFVLSVCWLGSNRRVGHSSVTVVAEGQD